MTASDDTESDRFTFFVALLPETARRFPENCVFLMIVEMARVLCCFNNNVWENVSSFV